MKIMIKKEGNKNENYLHWFLIIAAVLVILTICFPFVINLFFKKWEESGVFGDTFGALNALFSGLAFAGLTTTIIIQRGELKIQKIELELQRKEFLLNRVTGIIYNQLDRFEKSVNDFKININLGECLTGNDAIMYLSDMTEDVYYVQKSVEIDNLEMKEKVIKNLKLYLKFKASIISFSKNICCNFEIIEHIIYKTELEIEELNNLKNIFFENIGFVKMGLLQNISKITELERKYLSNYDYKNHNFEVGGLSRANIFLKSIVESYDLRLNKNNFEEMKLKWIKARSYNE